MMSEDVIRKVFNNLFRHSKFQADFSEMALGAVAMLKMFEELDNHIHNWTISDNKEQSAVEIRNKLNGYCPPVVISESLSICRAEFALMT